MEDQKSRPKFRIKPFAQVIFLKVLFSRRLIRIVNLKSSAILMTVIFESNQISREIHLQKISHQDLFNGTLVIEIGYTVKIL